MLSKTTRESLKCATFNHSRNTTYLVFVGCVSGGKIKKSSFPQNGALQPYTGHSTGNLGKVWNCIATSSTAGVQFSEMKCQSIGKFLEKEKELVCLNVTKGDIGTDNATYVAHTPEGQILPLEIRSYDPKGNNLV